MPLHEGAKPGSKEFGENIATEIKNGRPPKQAEAIAYSEARRHDRHEDGSFKHQGSYKSEREAVTKSDARPGNKYTDEIERDA